MEGVWHIPAEKTSTEQGKVVVIERYHRKGSLRDYIFPEEREQSRGRKVREREREREREIN